MNLPQKLLTASSILTAISFLLSCIFAILKEWFKMSICLFLVIGLFFLTTFIVYLALNGKIPLSLRKNK